VFDNNLGVVATKTLFCVCTGRTEELETAVVFPMARSPNCSSNWDEELLPHLVEREHPYLPLAEVSPRAVDSSIYTINTCREEVASELSAKKKVLS
jgi:hypothetical protein